MVNVKFGQGNETIEIFVRDEELSELVIEERGFQYTRPNGSISKVRLPRTIPYCELSKEQRKKPPNRSDKQSEAQWRNQDSRTPTDSYIRMIEPKLERALEEINQIRKEFQDKVTKLEADKANEVKKAVDAVKKEMNGNYEMHRTKVKLDVEKICQDSTKKSKNLEKRFEEMKSSMQKKIHEIDNSIMKLQREKSDQKKLDEMESRLNEKARVLSDLKNTLSKLDTSFGARITLLEVTQENLVNDSNKFEDLIRSLRDKGDVFKNSQDNLENSLSEKFRNLDGEISIIDSVLGQFSKLLGFDNETFVRKKN